MITVANTLVANYGISVPIKISGNYRLGDIRHNYADLTKINNRLGFAPSFTFQQGINKFTEWVNRQEIEADNYSLSIQEMKSRGLYR
ncbi:dTDP-L-rhamnose 4-epimerase [compost metagenome]